MSLPVDHLIANLNVGDGHSCNHFLKQIEKAINSDNPANFIDAFASSSPQFQKLHDIWDAHISVSAFEQNIQFLLHLLRGGSASHFSTTASRYLKKKYRSPRTKPWSKRYY